MEQMNQLAALFRKRSPQDIYQDYPKPTSIPVGPAVYPPQPNSLRDMIERVMFMKESQKPRMLNMTVRG